MAVTGQIALAGPPVRTVRDFFPGQAANDTPYSGFSFSVAGRGGEVLAVYGHDKLVLSDARDWWPG